MKKHNFRIILTAVALLLAAFSWNAAAESDDLMPKLPAAKGEQCVEPTDVMRRNHYEFILHKRDQTMHQGIRTSKYSLVECISCHVQPDEKNQFVSHESETHFCSSCHAFAAVKIDCFECHADKPTGPLDPSTHEKTSSLLPPGQVALSQASSVIHSSLYNTQVAR